jgi:protocatechuate 3,4-dioxygenase beta subunit
MPNIERPTRRGFLLTGVLAAGGLVAVEETFAQPQLTPTPACGDAPTARQTEGPFFKPRSPERADLIVPGSRSKPVELTGRVLTRSCKPVPRALVDLWHADEAGAYDNRSFRYRGHQFTDADGRYRFRTVVPAVYSGRTRHYHVKVQGAGRPVLTTQLYFPDEPQNRRDSLFRRELLMKITKAGEGLSATFDFVLDIS